MKIINIWELGEIIEFNTNTIIYNVIPTIINEDLEKTKWILKFSKNFISEIKKIEEYLIFNEKFCIKMPLEKEFRSGLINKDGWYVMEKYDGNLHKYFLFGKNNIKLLISNIINFIKWLHVEKKVVHGDLKHQNILINFTKKDRPFCLIDYESLDEPDNIACVDNNPDGYYYYGYGCEYDKPNCSFRYDLEAFGLILWALTLSVDSLYKFHWQEEAFKRYKKKQFDNHYSYLNALKQSYITPKSDLIINYYKIIEEVDWYEKNPDPDIYDRILKL